jgi:hypothetical protein
LDSVLEKMVCEHKQPGCSKMSIIPVSPSDGSPTPLQQDVIYLPFPKLLDEMGSQKQGQALREHENITGASEY